MFFYYFVFEITLPSPNYLAWIIPLKIVLLKQALTKPWGWMKSFVKSKDIDSFKSSGLTDLSIKILKFVFTFTPDHLLYKRREKIINSRTTDCLDDIDFLCHEQGGLRISHSGTQSCFYLL